MLQCLNKEDKIIENNTVYTILVKCALFCFTIPTAFIEDKEGSDVLQEDELYRCFKKCKWKHRWNFQMHQIYTVKQFVSEEFLSNRYHARQRTCAEEKLDKICITLQGNHWTHLHSKECDCIITNKIKLMYLHPYKTTVVYKLWQLSTKLNFVNWYLQRAHAGEVNLMLVLFSDEAWFHRS